MLKFIFAFAGVTFLSIAHSAPISTATTIVMEAKVDLNNIFLSHTKINPADYGIPSQITHQYTLRTTYILTLGKESASTISHVDAGCSGGGRGAPCTPLPAHDVFRVGFDIGKVQWELIDDSTKEIVGTQEESIKLQLPMRSSITSDGDFSGPQETVYIVRSRNSDLLNFRLQGKYILSFQEPEVFEGQLFENAQANIASSSGGFSIVTLNLEDFSAKNHVRTGPGLDANLGFFLSVGGLGTAGSDIENHLVSIH
jgi:hypothetical protein